MTPLVSPLVLVKVVKQAGNIQSVLLFISATADLEELQLHYSSPSNKSKMHVVFLLVCGINSRIPPGLFSADLQHRVAFISQVESFPSVYIFLNDL